MEASRTCIEKKRRESWKRVQLNLARAASAE